MRESTETVMSVAFVQLTAGFLGFADAAVAISQECRSSG